MLYETEAGLGALSAIVCLQSWEGEEGEQV